MDLLKYFVAQYGDFEFSCERQFDGTCVWSKKLLNTPGAVAEEVESVEEVPIAVLHAFSTEQITKQVQNLTA